MTKSASPRSPEAAAPKPLPPHLHSPLLLFLESLEETLTANTRAAYRRDLERYLGFLSDQGVDLLGEIDPGHVRQLLSQLQQAGLSAATVARNTSSIRRFHRFLRARALCQRDPTDGLAPLKTTRQAPDVLTVAEAARLVEAVTGSDPLGLRDRAILELLYGTGMTASELTALAVEDLLLESALVRILGRGARERTVPLGEPAVDSLDRYTRHARPELLRTASPGAADAGDRLFLNARGGSLSRVSVWKIIKAAARAAGIDRAVSPHTLRHSCAAHLVDGGGDPREVQQLLGHAAISTTVIYASHCDTTDVEAAHRIHHPRG